MGNDAVRVVPENVLARGLQLLRAVEAGGEVRGEERPQFGAAPAVAAKGELARLAGFGE